MKISQNSVSYNPNITNKSSFKGVPIAKVRLNGTELKDEILILQLGKKDIPFLKKMVDKLDLEKLYPDIKNKNGFDEWKEIIENAIEGIELKTKSLLAVRENRPSGIISYCETDSGKAFYIDHFATWPIRKGEGTKGTGKALIRQEFQDSLNSGKNRTFLIRSYIKPGNKDCCKFYKSVGFDVNTISGMAVLKQNPEDKANVFIEAIKNLDEFLDYKTIENADDINLNEQLNVNFIPGIFDNIKEKIKHLFKR